jgi:hypothetical protein
MLEKYKKVREKSGLKQIQKCLVFIPGYFHTSAYDRILPMIKIKKILIYAVIHDIIL